jgi:hypothetical protein
LGLHLRADRQRGHVVEVAEAGENTLKEAHSPPPLSITREYYTPKNTKCRAKNRERMASNGAKRGVVNA